MKMSPRESVLTLATLAAVVFAGSVFLVSPQIEKWQVLRTEWRDVQDDINSSRDLVEGRAKWEERYREMAQIVPQYPADKKMDVYWGQIMDQLAAKHGVNISRRLLLEEKRIGLLNEQPIRCLEWEGSLDGFVHFLYDLQYEGAMLDVREMTVKPKGDGRVRGSFTLHCAYTRARAPEAAQDSKMNNMKKAVKP